MLRRTPKKQQAKLQRGPAHQAGDVLCGWLTKMGGFSLSTNSWKKRWFILAKEGEGLVVYYFKDRKQSSTAAGCIDLQHYTEVERDTTGEAEYRRPWLIRLRNPARQSVRVHYLAADSSEVLESWLVKLRSALVESSEARRRSNVKMMPSKLGQLKQLSSVRFSLTEARKLRLAGSPDTYCVVSCGDFQVRTPTKEGTCSPFWAEEHTVETFVTTSSLVFTFFEQTGRLKDDRPFGRVEIALAHLKRHPVDGWIPIESVRRQRNVTGDLHVRIRLQSISSEAQEVIIEVVEARNLVNLGKSGGYSNPVVKVSCGKQTAKTSVIRSDLNPCWNEEIRFVIASGKTGPKYVQLTLESAGTLLGGGKGFLGQVNICLRDMEPNTTDDNWIPLGPKQTINDLIRERVATRLGEQLHREGQMGEVKLRATYVESTILPLEQYDAFARLLAEPPYTLLHVLRKHMDGQSVSDKDYIARPLVSYFAFRERAPELFRLLVGCELEACESPDTLFRANSLGSKGLDYFQKMYCEHQAYLRRTIGPIIDRVYAEELDFEVDPQRVKPAVAEANVRRLWDLAESLLDAVVLVPQTCPRELRQVYSLLADMTEERFPDADGIAYTVIGAFFFLRLVCPAILNPKLFQLSNLHPPKSIARTLTLAAKILQNMANLVLFGAKEPYLHCFNAMMQQRFDHVRTFYAALRDPSGVDGPHMEERIPLDGAKHLEIMYQYVYTNEDDVLDVGMEGEEDPLAEEKIRAMLKCVQRTRFALMSSSQG